VPDLNTALEFKASRYTLLKKKMGTLNSDERRRRNIPKVDFRLTKPPKTKKKQP